MSIFLILLFIYFIIGVVYTWKVTGYLGSYFKNKKSAHKQKDKGKGNFLSKVNPLYIIWISFDIILVLLWLPLLIQEKISNGK